MSAALFPFTLYATEAHGFNSSPRDFRATFLANRPDGLTWYAYDVTVQSPESVEFIVRGMRHPYRGGIGAKVGSFVVTVSRDVTATAIRAEALRHATAKRADELEAAEAAIIEGYADTILASAMSAGTAATTQIGAGLQPASAVANGETPKPGSSSNPGEANG